MNKRTKQSILGCSTTRVWLKTGTGKQNEIYWLLLLCSSSIHPYYVQFCWVLIVSPEWYHSLKWLKLQEHTLGRVSRASQNTHTHISHTHGIYSINLCAAWTEERNGQIWDLHQEKSRSSLQSVTQMVSLRFEIFFYTPLPCVTPVASSVMLNHIFQVLIESLRYQLEQFNSITLETTIAFNWTSITTHIYN